MFSKALVAAGVSLAAALGFAATAKAAEPPVTVALVHGAFADGSSWSRVIPLLQADGLRVVAVQNPLRSLTDDVAVTRRVIEAAPGPVVLVGHSWGGMVITEAGMDSKVKALVYVAAFALPKGQSINSASEGKPPAEWASALVADSAGYLRFSDEGVAKYFAQDAGPAEIAVAAATQSPAFKGIFDDRLTQAAYETKPSWFAISKADRAIDPALQRAMATAIHAQVTEVDGSHVIMLTKPREVADVIIRAAKAVK